jgi:hypothetical protein
MRRRLAWVLALGALSTAVGCARSSSCQNLVHTGCGLGDAGPLCAATEQCVTADEAIDPCAPGSLACCFQSCAADKDCPSGQQCVMTSGGSSVCALGRCDDDAGTSS